MRYTDRGQAEEEFIDQEVRQENGKIASMRDSAELLTLDQRLDEEDLILLPQVIRCLLTAASNIKLYPPESKTVSYSIEELQKTLQSILVRRPVFTLSQVGERLLANGTKIDIADFKTTADGFLKLMGKIGLSSLTFLKNISSQELKTFIVALGQPTDR